LKFIGRTGILAAIALVIATLIGSLNLSGVASSRSVIFDQQFVDALRKVETFIPPGSVVVTSTNSPFVLYFTNRIAKVPIGVSSEKSLLDYMVSRHYNYLLVFENNSQVPELDKLFSTSGLGGLKNDFNELIFIKSDFTKIHLYTLSAVTSETNNSLNWNAFTVNDIKDFGTPLLSDINSIQIRVTDDGTGPVDVWIGRLSLVDTRTQAETIIDTFESGHGYAKQSTAGAQKDDSAFSVNGSQSLKLTTDGDGRPVFTRKNLTSNMIDFTGKTVKVWYKISDANQLREFRITVSNDEYKSYRNFWIIR
jgi:hypothetical protein